MMNHLTSVNIAWDNFISVHILSFMHKDFLMGVLNHFAERLWGMETFSIFKMGYEIFSNCAKLSSALVLRIKNDRSLRYMKIFISDTVGINATIYKDHRRKKFSFQIAQITFVVFMDPFFRLKIFNDPPFTAQHFWEPL